MVYIVIHWSLGGDHEEKNIMGIWSTREAAEANLEQIKGYPANNEWWIEEWKVNGAKGEDQ